ncbi:hypothetical protein LCGC14_1836300 [marine sediment metagenome]|uniref:Uncharacterized protein n=1 Tax=marine sediment metagenome TaxID=412755 RepID=A0A0F9H2S0_9ZZZZ
MTLTRHPLTKCRTRDCPFTPKEHDEWMELCSRAPEHGHRHDQPSHQHWPKKGMGGRPSGSPLSVLKDPRSMRFYVARGAERHEVLEGMCAVCKKPLFDGDDVMDNESAIAPLTETATGAVAGESPKSSTPPKPSAVDAIRFPVLSRRGVKPPPSEEAGRRAIEETGDTAPVSLDLDGAAAESARVALPVLPKSSRARARATADTVGVVGSSAHGDEIVSAARADESAHLGTLAESEATARTKPLPSLSTICCGECITAGFTLDIDHDPSIIPESPRIVAILCWPMHDRIDNADWGNAVKPIPGRGRVYFAWDLHGNTLIEKDIDGQVLSDGDEARLEGEALRAPGSEESAGGEPGRRVASAPSLSTKEESDGLDTDVPGPSDDGASGEVGKPAEASPPDKPVTSGDGTARGSQYDPIHHPNVLTHDQRVAIAGQIKDAEWGRQWLAGDTANAWEAEMGQEAWQYLGDFGYQPESLSNIMNVCAAVPKRLRGYSLRFSHFVVVAGENLEDMEMWLDKCAEEQWSVKAFRRQVKGTKPRVKRWSLEELDELLKKFVYKSDEESVSYPTGPIGDAVIIFFQWLGRQA